MVGFNNGLSDKSLWRIYINHKAWLLNHSVWIHAKRYAKSLYFVVLIPDDSQVFLKDISQIDFFLKKQINISASLKSMLVQTFVYFNTIP